MAVTSAILPIWQARPIPARGCGRRFASTANRGEYTGLIIDGVDQRNSFFGEWFGSLETKNLTFPQDAIQEFQVRDSGFSAEFGHATGGLINVVTKSGTNEWHGSVHWFILPNTFVADTFIADTGTEVPPTFDARHQFGGTVGGPPRARQGFHLFCHRRPAAKRAANRGVWQSNRPQYLVPVPRPRTRHF